MRKPLRSIQYFLQGQHFSDGLRITLAILIPSLVLWQFGEFQSGIMLSLGALAVSISDSPGPYTHKRNGMGVTLLLAGVVSLLTGYARLSPYTLGAEVLLLSFLFALFGVYGARATSVGSAGLLVMILMMDRPMTPAQVWQYSRLLVLGGAWYMAISLSAARLLPYRAAQQALGACIHETAKFLFIKADFYSTRTDLDEDYRQLVAQQVAVSEQQDAVREVLFKSRQVVQDTTRTGRLLVLTFVDVVDLYEQIVAMYYDYADIRARFGQTGVLDDIARLIRSVAVDLDYLGLAVQGNRTYERRHRLDKELEALKAKIDGIGITGEGSNLVLKKILVSLRGLNRRLDSIWRYDPTEKANGLDIRSLKLDQFVSHQEIDPALLRTNLTLSSSIFRHSLRMAIAALTGFAVAKLIAYGHHSYWILLTITVILKPGYSLTKERNKQRLLGTLAGGLIGATLLLFIHDRTALFILMVGFMIGGYSFQRTNYVVMVVCITPFILILFHFLGLGSLGIIEERIVDTVIGSGIAFLASYLLFPRWESQQIRTYLRDTLRANLHYLQTLSDGLTGKVISVTTYKLARKDVYVSSANLSAAFQRMISEPVSKQRNRSELHQLVVLNHILSANVASIASTLVAGNQPMLLPADDLRPLRRSISLLQDSLRLTGEVPADPVITTSVRSSMGATTTGEDLLLKGQLAFIQKLSNDIRELIKSLHYVPAPEPAKLSGVV